MNVLIMGYCDYNLNGYDLYRAVNEFTDSEAKYLVNLQNHNRSQPIKYLAANHTYSDLINLMEWADFILYTSSYYRWDPHNIKPPEGTHRGVWHIGSYYRNNPKKCREVDHPDADIVFSLEDIIQDGDTLLRCIIDHRKFEMADLPESPIVIGHSPSKRSLKGTEYFLKAKEKLESDQVKFDLIEDVHYDECMERKRKCHMFFDQITSFDKPGYGLSFVESCLFGSVVMTQGPLNGPYYWNVRNADDIVNCINLFIRVWKFGNHLRVNKSRSWAIKTHGPEAVVTQFIDKISEVIEQPRKIPTEDWTPPRWGKRSK